MRITFYPLDAIAPERLRYAVNVAGEHGRRLFCRHRERSTWECPGGHIEPGETALAAARRELYEETGATEADVTPVCIYSVADGKGESFGLLCRAEITARGPLPSGSEIAQAEAFDAPPANLTYPQIVPALLARAQVCALSIREHPAYAAQALHFIQSKWASEQSRPVYKDCLQSALNALSPLPQWYLLLDGATPVGCAGLIPNDFISRMDLWPWLCALYVEESARGHGYGALLIQKARQDAASAGFEHLYVCTDHMGYYERYGFTYLGIGYHPWGESSRVYVSAL